MKRRIVVLLTVVLMVLATLVSSTPGFSQPPIPPGVEKLRQDAVGEVDITWNPRIGTPSFIRGPIPLHPVDLKEKVDPATVVLAFVGRYGEVFGLEDPKAELEVVGFVTDELGMTHVTLRQVYQGIEVYNAQVKVHLSADGKEVVAASNGFVPGIRLPDTRPRISTEQALAATRKALPNGTLVSGPKLVVYPAVGKAPGASAKLAWLVELRDDSIPARNVYVVDATEEGILDVLDRLYEQTGDKPASQETSVSQEARVTQSTSHIIISDGRFVYPSAKAKVVLEEFPTPLKELEIRDVDGNSTTAAEVFDVLGGIYGVAPEVLLTLAEMHFHALTDSKLTSDDLSWLTGNADPTNVGIWNQVEWAAKSLSTGFYAHYNGEFKDAATLKDGTIVDLQADNAGTYAILYHFVQVSYSREEWFRAIGLGEGSFYQTFRNLFGDPLDGVLHAAHPTFADYESMPPLHLPWPVGDTWNYTGGPHNNDGSGNPPLAAVDYQAEGVSGCDPQVITDRWIAAAAGGRTVNSSSYWLQIDHDWDDDVATGWQTTYLHIANQIPDGRIVRRGEKLGNPSCLGGSATGAHVHFAVKFQNVFQPVPGTMLSGWTIHNGSEAYHGTMIKDGDPLSPRESCYRPGGAWNCSRADIVHEPGRDRETYNANNGTDLPGTLARTEGQGPTGDRDVDNAHDFAGSTYDYYYNTHGRDSFDDQGATLISTVHYGRNYQNAFWNGEQTVYGDDFPVKDVVAHEWTHAVIEHSANLEYRWQSGALNESFSDIFGAMVDRDDWLMGEDLPPNVLGGREAIRDLSDPPRFGQPDHTDDWVETCSDNEGVHTNSGIPNKAYYNIATAIGKDKAERIFYRTLTVYLQPTASLEDVRAAALQSAQDLYGSESSEYNAVRDGFNAVGLDGQWNPPVNCCECGTCATLSTEPDGWRLLGDLRAVRDEVFSQDPGRRWTRIYYKHQFEVARLLLSDSQLRTDALAGFHAFGPVFRAMLEGDRASSPVILTPELIEAAERALMGVAERGSPALRDDIVREWEKVDPYRFVGWDVHEVWEQLRLEEQSERIHPPTVSK